MLQIYATVILLIVSMLSSGNAAKLKIAGPFSKSNILQQVKAGSIVEGSSITADLAFKKPTVLFVVRRPGWVLCREEAFDLFTAYKQGKFGNCELKGVIKEVAPCSTAKTDVELGVNEFQTKYFQNQPIYLDSDLSFYKHLGGGKLRTITGLKFSWNPFKIWKEFKNIGARIKTKGLEGNFRGEGLNLGGVIIYSEKEGICYEYKEITGTELPIDEISNAAVACGGKKSILS